jgi:hypothetical protein
MENVPTEREGESIEQPKPTVWSGLTHIAQNILVGMEYVGKIIADCPLLSHVS